VAPGEIIFAKKYHNEKHASFSEVCHLFMKEAKVVSQLPVACVLACAGPIINNTVEYEMLLLSLSLSLFDALS
jgi:glucokinase